MAAPHTPAGGRVTARRLLALTILLLHGAAAAAAGAQDDLSVTVREANGVYTVAASFEVLEPASVALAVLTDYEQIPRFMPDVKTSIVRQRLDRRVVVEQEAVSRMLMFSKRVHLLLDVREEADALVFHDASRRSFDVYEGAWRVAQQEQATIVTYELHARPSFDVPPFLVGRLLKRDAKQMVERLRLEIAARAATTRAGLSR
jgi:hypothetical protein